jgi:cytochrome c oxidase subunit 2
MNNRKFLASISLLVLGTFALTGCSPPAPAAGGLRVVAITANRYQFTPSEVTLKRGEPVKFRLTSEDMTHGLFVKDLAIDTDIIPGKTTEFTLTPQKSGKFTAICVHYCGPGHGNMHMTILVE